MLSDTTKKELILKAKLIFYGIPLGKNAPGDTPIVGNLSLAQVVINRIESVTKNREQFWYLHSCVMQFLKESKGQVVSKIKLDETNLSLVKHGLTDQNGVIIPTKKKLY